MSRKRLWYSSSPWNNGDPSLVSDPRNKLKTLTVYGVKRVPQTYLISLIEVFTKNRRPDGEKNRKRISLVIKELVIKQMWKNVKIQHFQYYMLSTSLFFLGP